MSPNFAVLNTFANFSIIASITLGTNKLMVMASGAAYRMRATLLHVARIALDLAVMLPAVAFAAVAPVCNCTWVVAGALRTPLAYDIWGHVALLVTVALIEISVLLIALDGRVS